MQNRMGLFSTATKLCMTFEAKSAKITATPFLKLGGQYVKLVDQYKYLGIVWETELSVDQDIQIQLRYQHCAANKLRASFSRFSNPVKKVLFRSFCTPMYCIHHNYDVISGRHACRDRVWHIILDARLYTTYHGSVSSHQAGT